MSTKTILIPMPHYGVDPSEVAIPWKLFVKHGFDVIFATPDGKKSQTDNIMLTGNKLGLLKNILAARKDAVDAYNQLEKSDRFKYPIKYDDINSSNFDAIYLPGGHDKKVREYLESKKLQDTLVHFFNSNKPVGAVCHGVLLAARSIDPATNKSVIHDYKTTCLLKSQEMLGYNLTRLWLGDYYLTYPEITVEEEVTKALSHPDNLKHGPFPILRDDYKHLNRGFIVKDRNFITGRWPGDVYTLSLAFIKMLEKTN